MKNVWKGLVVGAFTGAGIGLVLDLLDGGAQKFAAAEGRVEKAVQDRAPLVAGKVRHGVSEAVNRVQDADLPEQLREVAEASKRKAEVPEKLKDVAHATRQKIAQMAGDGSDAIRSLKS